MWPITSGLQVINQVGPEHLELCVDETQVLMDGIRHAGDFVGHRPRVLGDYCAGPNHVLPTSHGTICQSPGRL